MRILFIGNGNQRYAGLRHFGFDGRAYNGLVRNNHHVYFFSDRDEARYAGPFGLRALGKRKTNDKLVKVARHFQPHAIIMAHTELIENESLQDIRHILPDIRIASLNLDAVFAPQNMTNLHDRREMVDVTFITTGGTALTHFSTPKHPYYFMPNMTDRSVDSFRAFADPQPQHDMVCFMHNGPRDDQIRLKLANGLADTIPELRTCYAGFNGTHSMRGVDYLRHIGTSAMGLSLSRTIIDGMASTPETRYLYSSDRIAHVMGNGVLAFVPDHFGLQDLYAEDEVVFFSDLTDLIDKTRFYLQNPSSRQQLAENGWRKAHEEFNEEIIMRYVLERLFEQPLSRDYAWPTEAY